MDSVPPIITAEDIRSVISLDDARAAALDAFRALHQGTAGSPAPWHLEVPDHGGGVHVKGAYLAGASFVAVKLSTGFPGNSRLGIPTSDGFTGVIDAATGRIAALVLDGGYLTELRTGAAGALTLDLLAPATVEELAVIGTGGQARFQIDAALRVRHPQLITIHGRSLERATALADWTRSRTDARVRAERLSGQQVTAQAIVTVTASTTPILHADQIAPGTHITAVGADSPGKRELDPAIIRRAALVAVDSIEQSGVLGELQGLDDVGPVRTVGSLLAEGTPPRDSDAITVADLSGTGAQDAAIAALATARVRRNGR